MFDFLTFGKTSLILLTCGAGVCEAAGALEKMKPVVVPPMADIFLADQVHRPDQFHSFKVCTVELWHHGLDLTAVKHTHENGFNNIIIVMAQGDFIAPKFPGFAV